MCGLFGYTTNKQISGKAKRARNYILNGLAIAAESRGDHSTGIAYCHNNNCEIFKRTKKASKFIYLKEFKEIINNDPDLIIGHTRFATTGIVKEANAHPFKYGSIVGAHNGIISNYWQIDQTVRVDSEAIFSLLNRKKNDFNSLKELQGQFALSWLNTATNNLHFTAHDNPLALVHVPQLSTTFWTSEIYALKSAISTHYRIAGLKFMDLGDDRVYTLERDSLRLYETTVKFQQNVYNWDKYGGYTNYDIPKRDDYEPSEVKKYIDYNCSVCDTEFHYDDLVSYDYISDKLYCTDHVKRADSTLIETMNLAEFEDYYYGE